jgi:SAM-dependent methyltransferase
MNVYRKIRNLVWRASMVGLPRGPHVTRYYMYRYLANVVAARLPKVSGRVLSVSGSAKLLDVLNLQPTETLSADYPDYNFLDLAFPNDSFDFVLSDQVLEHVEGNPQSAIDESHRVLRPGGIAVHTTCFINPVHGEPRDFWRFTPDALALLHRNWTKIIDVGGWGNFSVWVAVKDGIRWAGVPHAKWHPLHKLAIRNDPDWPISTWIVAQK